MDGNRANKLGIVLKDYPKVNENFIIREISLLERMGYFIRVYALASAPAEHIRHRVPVNINAAVTYESCHAGWLLLDGFKAVFILSLRRPRSFFNGMAAFFRLLRTSSEPFRVLRDLFYALHLTIGHVIPEGITNLYSFFSDRSAAIAMLTARFSGIDFHFTATAHDIFTQSKAELLEKAGAARFVLVQTRHSKEYMRNLGPFSTPVYHLYHGVDLEVYNFPRKMRMPSPPYNIVTVGGFIDKQGEDAVLDALKILCERGVDFNYTLVGDGPERERLATLIAELGLGDRVRMTGWIGEDELLKIYHNADVFVLNGRVGADGDREDIPDVIVEAMACGVPVAVADSGAVSELVEQEETGMLFTPDDAVAIANSCMFVLEDDISREMIIIKARLKVEGRFNLGKLIPALVEVYEDNEVLA